MEVYPLVNCYITMERSTMLSMGKSTINISINGDWNTSYVKLPEGTTYYNCSMLFWHQTCHAATCRNRWHSFPKLPIGGNGVEYSHVSFHLGIDLVLMLMSETAWNKHGSPAVTHQWSVCTPNISQFLLLGMVFRWPGFMAWVKEVGNHTDLQPPHAWHSGKIIHLGMGMDQAWLPNTSMVFVEKHDPTCQRGFVCWPSSPAPTSRNNRSQLAWRQFTLCNDVCVICFSKLHGSFPSLPSLKWHSKLMTYRFTTVYWRFPPVPIWVNMTVVSRDDHLKYGWKWNMMKDVWNPHLVYHALRRIQVKAFLTSPAAHQLSAINTSNHLGINVNVIESFIDDSPIHWLINFWIFMEDKSMDSSHEKTP